MPASTIVRLALRLAEAPEACSACCRHGYRAGFRLYDLHASGCDRFHGIATCPACVAAYGHHHALVRALAAEEAAHVARDGADRADRIAAIRARFAHLRSLVVTGRIRTPPPIPLDDFAPAPA